MRWFALVLLLAGCKPAVDPAGPAPLEEDDPAAGGATAVEPVEGGAEPVPVRRSTGEIERAALLAEVDRGPGQFLTGVRIKAQFQEERFLGWRVDKFYPDDPRFAGVDLRPGDIVMTINDWPLATPDQMFDVCRKLRDADAVRVRGLRAGAPFELVFRIVGPAPATPPRS